jgi:nicotinamide mononucleotide transporter
VADSSILGTLIEQLKQTTPWEATAAALGLVYLLLAMRRNLLCWLCAFLSTGLYIVVFPGKLLYMQSLLQVFYLVVAVYGFIDWRKGRTDDGDVRIESWSIRQHLLAALLVIIATILNGWLLQGTDSPAPYLDSFVTWASVVTTWMVARRIIENWLYWIVVDSAAAWLYFSQGLLVTTLLFIVYVGIVVRGYYVWRRDQALQRTGSGSGANVAASSVESI